MSAEQRAAVAAEARSWIRTSYHHMGRIKATWQDGKIIDKGGVDCATLLAEVYERAGMVPHFDVPYYPPDWHMHRSVERYLQQILQYAHQIEEAQALPGDLVVYRFGRTYSHGAIIVDPGWPAIVHAKWRSDLVHEDRGDIGEWADRPRQFYSLWA
jgi:cell wall-associated NlpC family hydrolase